MKKLIFALALSFCLINCTAQTDVKQLDTIVLTDSAKTIKEDDKTFTKVEVESVFPGGRQGWASFLQENLNYPKKAIKKNIQGTVILKFIVCTDGTVCDIEAISGPEELRKSAVETLKKTPNWVPAYQNGRKVKAYKTQPIIYRLED